VTKKTTHDVQAEIDAGQIKLVIETIATACKMLLALKPILDGLLKGAQAKK